MNQEPNSEAAETVQTKSVPAVDLPRLVLRFRHMADARYDVAVRQMTNGRDSQSVVAAADAYMRCARELERAMAGEVPPAPGHEWPEEADCRNLCN